MSETAVDTVNISKSLYMMIALGLTFVYFWDILLFCKTPLFAQPLCTTKYKLFFLRMGFYELVHHQDDQKAYSLDS